MNRLMIVVMTTENVARSATTQKIITSVYIMEDFFLQMKRKVAKVLQRFDAKC